ncbi:G protein-coupled receptor gpr1, partial [Conoideocrella luteorostrata]
GRSGLYPYRHYAYITVAGVSLTLASLAFLNRPAFVNSGPYCYLPTQPDWTNKALSWIPRYVVVATILLTYTCIYIYVRCAMTNVDDPGKFRNANGPYRIDGHQVQEQGPAGPAIQSPPIAYHGLIPPTPPCEGILTDYGLDGTAAGSPNAPLTQSQCVQVLPQAGRENGRQKPGPKSPLESDACCAGGASLLPIHEYRPFSEFERSIYCLTSDEQCASTSRLRVSTPHKIFCQRLACTTKSISQRESAPESNSQVPESCHELVSLPGLALSPTTMNTTGRLKMRDKMRRQVGRLFVYPLVYMTGWLIPFVSHVLGGDNTERPFWLILAGLISLCIQGMADSLVFLLMEKPWRSWITDESLFCLIRWNQQSATKGNNTRVGRTGEEMPIDGIIARKRRKQEEAERRQGPGQPASAPNSREWWDTTLASIDEPSGEEDVEATHPGANNQSRFWP